MRRHWRRSWICRAPFMLPAATSHQRVCGTKAQTITYSSQQQDQQLDQTHYRHCMDTGAGHHVDTNSQTQKTSRTLDTISRHPTEKTRRFQPETTSFAAARGQQARTHRDPIRQPGNPRIPRGPKRDAQQNHVDETRLQQRREHRALLQSASNIPSNTGRQASAPPLSTDSFNKDAPNNEQRTWKEISKYIRS